MTEIPEHLLKRSKERKAALSGETPEADATEDTSAAVEPAAAAAPAPAAAPLPDVAPDPEPEPVKVAPYVEAYEKRKKMPYWIVPVLLALPVWAAFYVGTLERVPQGLSGLLGEGEELYVEDGCSGCHGAEGGGGIGRALADGEAHITFTTVEDQMVWVLKGSALVGTGETYSSADSTRPRAVAGQMPGYGAGASTELDVEQLLAVVLYERTQFEPVEDLAAVDLELAAEMDELIETGAIEEILAEQGLSIHDVLAGEDVTADVINRYLEPARAALAGEEEEG